MVSSSPQLQPLVSIVIPCYNAEQWVGEAIQSCLNQTYQPLEIILVDDGSSDGTSGVLREWAARYPAQIRAISQPQSGAPAARNAGLKIASGQYIQFLDSDDVLLPPKIELQMQGVQEQIAKSQTAPDLVIGNYIIVYREGEQKPIAAEVENCWIGLMKTRLGYTSANLWRREAVLHVGGWDEKCKSGQEYDLMFRLLKVNDQILYVPKWDTHFWQRNGQSIMRKDPPGNLVRSIDQRKRIREYLVENGKFDAKLKNALDQSYFFLIRRLYEHRPKQAISFHRELIPRGFAPELSEMISRTYQSTYKILGFRNSELLKSAHDFIARKLRH